MNKNFWFTLTLIMLILMSFSTLRFNAGFEIRLNQIFILFVFFVVFLNDLKNKTLNIKLLAFLIGFGILLSLISLNSPYHKIGQLKFIIKYIFIFPAVFYTGSRLINLIGPKLLIKAAEISVLIYCIDAIILYYFPIPFLIHNRGALTGFQGTFWETVWLAKAVMLLLLTSISLRFDFNIFPRKKYLLLIFYIFLIIIEIITRSKAVWVALGLISLYLILSKFIFNFISYKKLGYNFYIKEKIISKIQNLNIAFLIPLILIIGITLYIANNYILEKPIVTTEMIQEKMQEERGKAFRIALELLKNSNWLGGYGFGYIESFFSSFYDRVIGLGAGVNMLFNSYLDVWISVGVIGLIYVLALLIISFNPKYFFTTVIPIYLFTTANISPYIGSEYYWLFLGLSFGLAKLYKTEDSI